MRTNFSPHLAHSTQRKHSTGNPVSRLDPGTSSKTVISDTAGKYHTVHKDYCFLNTDIIMSARFLFLCIFQNLKTRQLCSQGWCPPSMLECSSLQPASSRGGRRFNSRHPAQHQFTHTIHITYVVSEICSCLLPPIRSQLNGRQLSLDKTGSFLSPSLTTNA